MVDARDLKSLGTEYRAGSIPALGTKNRTLSEPEARLRVIVPNKMEMRQ
jgi:hypothetical protein